MRVSAAVGVAAEAANAAERAAIRTGTAHPSAATSRLYVEMDGTGVPAVPTETQGRAGKAADGTARTREAKLGCVFTQFHFDAEGWPVRDPDSTTYVGAIEPAEEFGPRLHAEALRRGLTPATTTIVLGGRPGFGTAPTSTSQAPCRSSICTMPVSIWKRSGAWPLAAALRPVRLGSQRAGTNSTTALST